jgi:hypothetical protein
MTGSTPHLREAELVDQLEGALPAARRAHLQGCEACRQRAAGLSAVLDGARAVDVPEPPPFFWEQLSARLRDAVANEPAPRRRAWTVLRPSAAGWAVLCGIATIVLALGLWRVLPSFTRALPAPVVAGNPVPLADSEDDGFGDIEADEGWALVRTVADELPSEAIDAEGIAPPAGSADAMVSRMSDLERIALAQILEDEMKKTKPVEAAS